MSAELHTDPLWRSSRYCDYQCYSVCIPSVRVCVSVYSLCSRATSL